MTRAQYLRDLAERIFRIPVMHGVDQHDWSILHTLAGELDTEGTGNQFAPFHEPDDLDDLLG